MAFNWWNFKGGKSKGCSVCAIALLSFTAGSLITARLAHIDHVRADSNRVSSFAFITLCRANCQHWNRGFETSIQSC